MGMSQSWTTDIKGYIEGYPQQYTTYPAVLQSEDLDDGTVELKIQFECDGSNYIARMIGEKELLGAMTEHLTRRARKALAYAGKLIWPPPISDAKAWGFSSDKPWPEYPFVTGGV